MKKSKGWVAILSALALGAAVVLGSSSDVVGGAAPNLEPRLASTPDVPEATVQPLSLPDFRAGSALAECAQAGGYAYACKINGWTGNDMNGRYVCPLDPWDGDSGYNEIVIARSDGGSFDWQAARPVGAIIVQTGSDVRAFRYEPRAAAGTRLEAPGSSAGEAEATGSVTFCWNRG
jgi:hypothetical protein